MFQRFLAALSEAFPTQSTAPSGAELEGFLDVVAGFGGMLDSLGGRVGKDGWGGWSVVDGLSLPVGNSVMLPPDTGLFFSYPLLFCAHHHSFDFSQLLMGDLSTKK